MESDTLSPDEVDQPPSGKTYPEGATTTIVVNAYERNRGAREACITAFGHTCSVCQFDFTARYGRLGTGYIHVHHLVDLSTVGDDYKVDPINDLRPVCPNCHAMLHKKRPAMNLDDLRARLVK